MKRPVEKCVNPIMRRKRMRSSTAVSRRSGVTVSVMTRNLSVQTPVSFVTSPEGVGAEMAGERSPGDINRRAQPGEENNGLDDETDDACAVSH